MKINELLIDVDLDSKSLDKFCKKKLLLNTTQDGILKMRKTLQRLCDLNLLREGF